MGCSGARARPFFIACNHTGMDQLIAMRLELLPHKLKLNNVLFAVEYHLSKRLSTVKQKDVPPPTPLRFDLSGRATKLGYVVQLVRVKEEKFTSPSLCINDLEQWHRGKSMEQDASPNPRNIESIAEMSRYLICLFKNLGKLNQELLIVLVLVPL